MSDIMVISKCAGAVRSTLQNVKDFSLPIGLTVGAIALSALSMGLSLGFIPSIASLTAQTLQKRKEKKWEQMTEQVRKELLNDLATGIEREMRSNESLRGEVTRLLDEAMKSKELGGDIRQNRQLAMAIHDKVSSLVKDFPELKVDVKEILTRTKEISKAFGVFEGEDWEDWRFRNQFLESCDEVELNDGLIGKIAIIALNGYHWINRMEATNLLGRNIKRFPQIREALKKISKSDEDKRIRDAASNWIEGTPTSDQLKGPGHRRKDKEVAELLRK